MKNNTGLVNVLLATYNGERFLQEQLDSIYYQSYGNLHITARDDGSEDLTFNMLQQEALKGKLTLISTNTNLGPAHNFFTLLQYSDPNADYFAFCDQDDIWNKDKIERAIGKISKVEKGVPGLYCSSVDCVDDSGRFLKRSTIPKKLAFENALVENVVTGCTIVLNKSAKNLLLSHIPEKCMMHDAWSYLVVSCFGEIVFDDVPSLRYRQHYDNTVGAAITTIELFGKRFKNIFKKKNLGYQSQASQFLCLFESQISTKKRALLEVYVQSKYSFFKRLILFFNTKIFRQKMIDTILFKLLIVLNLH